MLDNHTLHALRIAFRGGTIPSKTPEQEDQDSGHDPELQVVDDDEEESDT
jgi:hypothetical protein